MTYELKGWQAASARIAPTGASLIKPDGTSVSIDVSGSIVLDQSGSYQIVASGTAEVLHGTWLTAEYLTNGNTVQATLPVASVTVGDPQTGNPDSGVVNPKTGVTSSAFFFGGLALLAAGSFVLTLKKRKIDA